MDPVGIEPTPLVLQTSVRTSYTKGPLSPVTRIQAMALRERCYSIFVGHCGIEPHLLTERFYRPLITPVTEASQFLYLVVESNYCHFHVKEIRSHYANEAGATPDHN